MKKPRFLGLVAASVALLGTLGSAAILELSLSEIVTQSDQAVFGEITQRTVHKVVGQDSTDYYTTVTIEGRLVGSQTPVTVDVVFGGGFINETEGVYNSEAPAAEEVRVGKHVVAFYKWQDGFAGTGANALYNMHGGLYRTDVGPTGSIVLGRGKGYAVDRNVTITKLDAQVAELQSQKKNR